MGVRKAYPAQNIDGANLEKIIDGKEFYGAGSLFAHVKMEQGAIVDWHVHNGETEYYYVLSGRGIFTDSDKSEIEVSKGDVCTIVPDTGHGIRNPYPEILEFIALVINKVE